jgi:hypothetical protein
MNSARRLATPLCLVSLLFLIACREKGPMEVILEGGAETYETLRAVEATPETRGRFIKLLQDLSPVLHEGEYVHPEDLRQKDALAARASLLMSATAQRLSMEKATRELYMNAYLIRGAPLLAELKPLLPAGASLEVYEKVRIPEYKILEETPGEAVGPEPGKRLVARVEIAEDLEYYLMQMVCGHYQRQALVRTPDLAELEVTIERSGAAVATGRWDSKKDEIALKLL